MRSILHTPLGEIQEQEILHVIQDFCHLKSWCLDHYPEHTLFNFLDLVMREGPKALSLDRLAAPVVLGKKMGQLQDHQVYAVCRELNGGDTMEQYAGITLLSFLKKRFSQPASRKKSKGLTRHELDIRIIKQRRKNASGF